MFRSPLRILPRLTRRAPSPFHTIRASPFTTLDPSKKIEEGRMPAFKRGLYYPVQLGDTLNSKYRVVSKLGFGANATIWLCRDMNTHRHIALKVYIHTPGPNREVAVLKHISSIKTKHAGKTLFRDMLDTFEIDGPEGRHQCIVFEPLLTSVLHLQSCLNPPSLLEDVLKPLLLQTFLVLDYLHSEADIQAKNIMIACSDNTFFEDLESLEKQEPSPYKATEGHTIYKSRPFTLKLANGNYGLPLLSDFGEARIGPEHTGIIQPTIYRAPEVVLGMNWTSKVDIWNVGTLLWDLFEDHHLFDGRGPDRQHSDEHLLAEMTAVLGTPPACFLRKCPQPSRYWDESGQWIGEVKIPDLSLEDSEEYLEGENKDQFMKFMRKMLHWDPDCRQTARELMQDEWLVNYKLLELPK
ncbi:kinase-like protein [Penicillium angulare]|uniref:Kinase-like protein n=1 Tax=Penicillium angulare TaxID=116970 RepID=A0A9W9FI69_9EURO|nr:kinase-like protein [Penicillium angulare]